MPINFNANPTILRQEQSIQNGVKEEEKEEETKVISYKFDKSSEVLHSSLDILGEYNKGDVVIVTARRNYNNEDDFWNDFNGGRLRPGDHGMFFDNNGVAVRFYMVTGDEGDCYPVFEYGKMGS